MSDKKKKLVGGWENMTATKNSDDENTDRLTSDSRVSTELRPNENM